MEIRWLALVLILGLVGCSTPATITRTETIEVSKPILYCPAVDMTQLERPGRLPIDTITTESPPGEVAVLYKATVKILVDYTERLELMLDEYGKFNKSYEELAEELNLEKTE